MWKRPSLEPLVAHSPIAVARFILAEAEKRDFTMTPMKLLKIVFLSHGWMLGLYGIPLVRGPVEAWQYGPVFPELYHAIKHLGAQPVALSDLPPGKEEVFDPEAQWVMVDAVERYGPLSASWLSTLTHAPSSPWELTYRDGRRHARIPNDLIEFYYRKMMELHRNSLAAEDAGPGADQKGAGKTHSA